MIKRLIHASTVLFCVLAAASHAEIAEPGPSNRATDTFQTVDKRTSNLIRVSPNVNWAGFRTYRFAPAVYEPSGSARELEPEESSKLRAIVDRSLQRRFAKPAAGEGAVLDVRPVITSFKRTDTALNVVGFALIQAPISFGGASIRYELFDGLSGEQVGEISFKRNARPWNVYPWNALKNFEALGQGSVILKSDSGRLRKDLERLAKLPVRPGQDTVKGAE